MENIKLSNGLSMPMIGFGAADLFSWQESSPRVEKAISEAIEAGYRTIDTASIYKTEKDVGNAIKNSKVPRNEFFVVTKVWNTENGYDETLKSFDESQKNLDLEQVDLFLIHFFLEKKFKDTYKALEKLYEEKRVKSIGVCNFTKEYLEKLFAVANVKPMVDQVELHPYYNQKNIREFCKKEDIAIMSWSPLGSGNWSGVKSENKPITDPVIEKIGKKYGKSPAQVIIRWNIQHGLIVIPKSEKKERMKENINVFDFALSKEDMNEIDGLNKDLKFGYKEDNFIND